MNGW
jgi:hypothetical protein